MNNDHTIPLVSIVTPARNGGRYLSECIQSVAAQTYGNLEHVILDNASTDGTSAITACYAASDPRVRLVRRETFLPIIDNWNRALDAISGRSRFVTVLPADDTFAPNAIEEMIAVSQAHPAIGIVGSLRKRGTTIHCLGLPESKTIFSGPEIARLFFREKIFALGPTGNLIRRELIDRNRPFFPNRFLHADTAAFFNVLTQADFGFVHQVLLFERVHADSVTSRIAHTNGTLFRDGLLMLNDYGPRYFSVDELSLLRSRYLTRYYRFLVRSAVLLQGTEFFRYHLDSLREAGFAPNYKEILHAVIGETRRALARPDKVISYLLLRLGGHGLTGGRMVGPTQFFPKKSRNFKDSGYSR